MFRRFPSRLSAPLSVLSVVAVVLAVVAGMGSISALGAGARVRDAQTAHSSRPGHGHKSSTPTAGATSSSAGSSSAPASSSSAPVSSSSAPVSSSSAPVSSSSAPVSSSSAPVSSSPTTTTTPSGSFSCSEPIGSNCGAYDYAGIPWSNGYNTYVSNQGVDVHGTETVQANNPGDWQVTANLSDCGGCVQTFPDVQQLTNNWGAGGFQTGSQDTPWKSLTTLKVHYDETSPASGASYEFAPDIWGPGGWDIMFWVDTQGRCNEGSFGPSTLGHYTDASGSWTVHRYDPTATNTGYTDNEIIIVLDGPGGPGTCAQQHSGTVDIKAGLDWLWANGFIRNTTMSQLNTGWEITQSSGATFRVNSYSIEAN